MIVRLEKSRTIVEPYTGHCVSAYTYVPGHVCAGVDFCCDHLASVLMCGGSSLGVEYKSMPTGKLGPDGYAITSPEAYLDLCKGPYEAPIRQCPFCLADIKTVVYEEETKGVH